ncbi:uncharacterized protein [Polyergus mexicanus]|uniref:uncharacterized protein n=1 Tax=Polyergus mexicanus TaxID=615972 RepID=UPI0038B65F1E
METLESSRVCRLCGQQSGISINIFDESENHVRKINAVLPIMVHEMDLLPKQMCHRCSYKLEEFHKFYVDCLKTDAALKSQLSWMRKGREKIDVPMVHIENVKIKTESLDYDVYELEPLIENMEYINSMNSMALPADGIHNGLTYATLSRYRCCCDKKDQSIARRTTAEFCRNYRESVSRCGEITGDSRKRTFENTAARIRPIKRNFSTQAVFPDCPQNRLSCVDAVENARDRLITDTNTKDNVFSLKTRNRSYGLKAVSRSQAASENTIVRNLRPRNNLVNYASSKRRTIMQDLKPKKNLVNYASNKKRTSIDVDSGPSVTNNSDISNPKTTFTSNFKWTRQIKVEQMDELEGRNLRPRKNVVNYQESKMRKVLSDYRAKRRKVENTEQNSKLHSKNENEFVPKLKIKQEVLDDLEDTMLNETNAISRLPNNSLADLPAKVEASTSDNDVSLQDDMSDYFKSSRLQLRNKFQLAKRKSLSNIMKNRLVKTKKIY